MNSKLIRRSCIIWAIVEISCVIAFAIAVPTKVKASEIISTILSLLLMTCLAILLLSFQIRQTWLKANEGLGKFTSIFWQLGSLLGILWELISLISRKMEGVIVLPIFVAVFLVGFNWTKYMQENSPVVYRNKQTKNKAKRDKEKIVI